eukprot:g1752.t1
MQGRLRESMGAQAAERVWMGTFHGACLDVLRWDRNVERLRLWDEEPGDGSSPYRRGFGIYDEKSSLKAIREVVKDHLGRSPAGGDDDYAPKDLQKKITEAKNIHGLYTARMYRESPYASPAVADVFEIYEKLLHDRNQLDFDDMLWLTLRLFHTQPEVLAHFRRRWTSLLVDEFQDTNGTQYRILRELARREEGEQDGKGGQPRSVFVVGDQDQAIYGFRGADSDNQLRYDKDFNPTIYNLVRNYRSRQSILDVAHSLILPNYNVQDDDDGGDQHEQAGKEDEGEEASGRDSNGAPLRLRSWR